MTASTAFQDERAERLRLALAALVPLRIDEVRRSGVDPMEAIRRLCGEAAILEALEAGRPLPISSEEMVRLIMAEGLVAGGGSPGALPALVTALALLAFTPGGVRAFGLRFDASHYPDTAPLRQSGVAETQPPLERTPTMTEEFEFASVHIERGELMLLHRLLERAQEAGLVQEGEQDDFGALQTLIRDFVLDFEMRPQASHSEDLDVDPARVPHLPGAQQVGPGLFLVPGRLETEQEARAREAADLDLEADLRDAHSARMEEAWRGRDGEVD